jgi:hypothetical protein
MTQKQVDIIGDTLANAAPENGVMNVLEWGSGGSTVHFSHYLRLLGKHFTWLSIEHDPQWAGAAALYSPDCVTVARTDDAKAYVEDIPAGWLVVASRPFYDVAIVDGLHRQECLAVARKIAKVTIVHDAQDADYLPACEGACVESHEDGPDKMLIVRELAS